MEKKILFIVAHRKTRSPGQRFRFEQYLNYLQSHGYQYTISNLLNQKDDAVFYQQGHLFAKIIIYLKCIIIRCKDVLRAKKYDVIFIYREAVFTRTTFFEKLFCLLCKNVFVDFDDAIYLLDVSRANRKLSWLKNPEKINKTLQKCSMAIVGNEYLASHARRFCKDVRIFPTTLDLNEINIVENQKDKDKICIGWIGSTTTIKHIEWAVPILEEIEKKYKEGVCFKIIADVALETQALKNLQNIRWSKESESVELSSFDIGIMPLPDNEWTRGKCGFKALQCMAYRIPVIASPVGVNTKIIQDGQNGFLATNRQEWVDKLSLLIENETLRKKLGKSGRQTVEKEYSFDALKDVYLSYFDEFTNA